VGRDSSVGVATRYGLDGRESNPCGGEFFRTRPDGPWGQPILLHTGYRVFPGGKPDGAWRWTPTASSTEVEGSAIYLLPLCTIVACQNFTFTFNVTIISI
jgi:hypothetical protein